MGAVALFPTCYDLEQRVRGLMDQSLGKSGGNTWDPGDFTRELTASVNFLLQQLVDQDVHYQTKEATVSVAANSGEIPAADLPADMIGVHQIFEVDGSGNHMRDLPPATWDDLGRKMGRIWLPTENRFRLTLDDHGSMTVKIVYIFRPFAMVNGIAQDGGNSSIQLASHEAKRNPALIGQTLYLVGGTGDGQDGVAASFDGPTQTVTLQGPWSGISGSPVMPVGDDTIYTCQPPLPHFAEDSVVYDTAVRLLSKLQDARYGTITADRNRFLTEMKQSASFADRHQAKRVRDHAGYVGFGDPVDRSGWRRPGNWY